ncbi:hypothetical protein PPYR_14931 [Photinus pyralis]|uniref:Uncharacterized protein n=1 Tax=Photinus pyralis TaxID=7054 RepID=A0A5N4A006_PHOPY|nr:hypothetical protein PPYR_14931 [Photinus pyralis]
MWDIIIWKNENAIDFVPCNWANENNTMYKYPLGMSETKVRETIYECKELCENYKWCDVELRKQCIKSLQRAKELCDKGQYTSNLETSDDENEDTKRKRTKRYIEECGQSEKRKTVGRRQLEEEDHNKDSEEETSTDRRKTCNFPERHARRSKHFFILL